MSLTRRLPPAVVFQLIVFGYVLIQVYAAWRAQVGLALPGYAVPLLAAWVVLMTFSLPLQWWLERRGSHRLATVLAWIGFGWMGWVFLFFWIALALAFVSALAGAVPSPLQAHAAALGSFPLAALLALAVAAYGFFDARRIRIERIRLASPKLSAANGTFRLVLISDVHLGTLVGARRLRRLVARLQQLDADVLVSAGDLVDGSEHRLRELAPMFGVLQPRLGKYAVTGNHEYYAGLAHALQFHRLAGFRVLQGEASDVTDEISIVGVDDPTGHTHPDERVPLSKLAQRRFRILLKHQPVLRPDAEGLFDLQLSGHVHQGQIFPFGLLVRLAYPVRTGLTRLARGGWLYVSRGTGTWGPPMRVGAPPEITLFEIEAA